MSDVLHPLEAPDPRTALVEKWRKSAKAFKDAIATDQFTEDFRAGCIAKLLQCADELAALRETPKECAPGFHWSGSRGYGHQKCIHCGHEWEFSPPAKSAALRETPAPKAEK